MKRKQKMKIMKQQTENLIWNMISQKLICNVGGNKFKKIMKIFFNSYLKDLEILENM